VEEPVTRIETYRDLIVWQKAIDLVAACYELTRLLPRSELFGIAAQIQRAAVSVSSNLPEGSGRIHRAEFRQHTSIARGSLFEVLSLLAVVQRLGFASPEECRPCIVLASEISRMLAGLLHALAAPAKPR
jgi:four helix bundle protein